MVGATPNFNTKQEYDAYLHRIFSPVANAPDPVLAFTKIAVENDIPPSDATYYWLIHGGRNSLAFKIGLRNLKDMLDLIVLKPEYLKKYGSDYIKYLQALSHKV